MITISYVPLLYCSHPLMEAETVKQKQRLVKEFTEAFKEAEEKKLGLASACMWVQDTPESTGWPIFIMDYGREIAKHLLWWSQGKPSKFFQFELLCIDECYAAHLMPNLDRSASRLDYNLGEIGISDIPNNQAMVFVPLRFYSPHTTTIQKLFDTSKAPQPGDEINFGILDKALIDVETAQFDLEASFVPDDIDWVEGIPVVEPSQHLMQKLGEYRRL